MWCAVKGFCVGSELHWGSVGNWKPSEGSQLTDVHGRRDGNFVCGDLYVTWWVQVRVPSEPALACSQTWNTRVTYDKATVTINVQPHNYLCTHNSCVHSDPQS